MENASKALIIAGGFLIAILVISLLVTGWNKLTYFSRTQEEIQTVEQIIEFNKEIESYNKHVLRGYELISLENLVNDTNERYSTVKGYKKLEFYIKLLKNTTLVNSLSSETTTKNMTQSYTDINSFKTSYNNVLAKNKDLAKIYKESYFQCDKMEYDGESAADGKNGSARVQKIYFSQIEKK